MTDGNATSLAAVLDGQDRAAPHGPVAATETVAGALILRDHSAPPGSGIFRDWHFDLPEFAETLEVTTAARVYEEVTVHKTATSRQHRVADVLRREEAEVEVEGHVEGMPAPRPGQSPP